MRNLKLYIVCILIVLFSPVLTNAQELTFIENDSIRISDGLLISEDSLVLGSSDLENKEVAVDNIAKKFSPDPNKAVIYAAIFPGLGQIYNRKYWKLPLVYGSVIGCVYAITWNGTQYSGYKDAYSDFRYVINYEGGQVSGDFNPNRNSWEDYAFIINKTTNLEEWSSSDKSYFSQVLKRQRDRFRRYRDLSYIASVGLYAVWIIDAYVDAQLFNFDISEDLSMNVQPVIFERNHMNKNTFGLLCSFSF